MTPIREMGFHLTTAGDVFAGIWSNTRGHSHEIMKLAEGSFYDFHRR